MIYWFIYNTVYKIVHFIYDNNDFIYTHTSKAGFFVVIQATFLSDFVSGKLLDVRPRHSCTVFSEIFLQKAR